MGNDINRVGGTPQGSPITGGAVVDNARLQELKRSLTQPPSASERNAAREQIDAGSLDAKPDDKLQARSCGLLGGGCYSSFTA